MKSISVKAKIAGAFALLLTVVLVLGIFAMNRIGAVNQVADEMGKVWVPGIEYAGAVNTLFAQVRITESRHIMDRNGAQLLEIDRLMSERLSNIGTARATFEPLIETPQEREVYAEFSRLFDEYMKVHNNMIGLSSAHQKERAEALFAGESLRLFLAASAKLDDLVRLGHEGADAASAHGADIYTSARNLLIGVLVLTVAVTAAMAWFLIANVSAPVAGMTKVMTRLADNDFSVVVPDTDRGDELGCMAKAVQVFKDKMEANRRMEAEVKQAENRAAEQRKRDMNTLADQFDASVKSIVDAVSSSATEMQAQAQALSSVAEQAQRQSTSVAAAAEQATANVQTVSAATTELSSSVEEIGRQVEFSSRTSTDAVNEAARVGDLVNALSAAASRIGDVVKLINDIASQTNLLALNATIEAARAGEAGKGFAVVASEVKNLANQTAKATDEIGQQIASVQQATNEAVGAIQGISGTISQINEIAGSIAAAVEQQSAATQEIARNIQQAAQGTGEVSSNIVGVTQASGETGAAASQVLAAAGDLSQQSSRLRNEVDTFIATVRAG